MPEAPQMYYIGEAEESTSKGRGKQDFYLIPNEADKEEPGEHDSEARQLTFKRSPLAFRAYR